MRRNSAKWALLAVVAAMAVPSQAQRKPARPQVLRPDGPVWTVIQENCISCHGIDDYAFYALDRSGWEKLIRAKHQELPVTLKAADSGLLVEWLAEKFGPDTKPFPRAYVPEEITEFFSDPEGYRMVNRACTKCHAADRIDGQRATEERWRAIVLDMRERGADIADKEIEQLVEWLGRVRGTNQGN